MKKKGVSKPNTYRKYRAVLNRFLRFFSDRTSVDEITEDDLNDFMIHLKRDQGLGNNTVVRNLIIVAQFMKKSGKGGVTKGIDLPSKMSVFPGDILMRICKVSSQAVLTPNVRYFSPIF